MDYVLNGVGELFMRLEGLTPRGPLIALPLFALAWSVAGRWERFRKTAPTTAALVRLWSAMLSLGCASVLVVWMVGTHVQRDGAFPWFWFEIGGFFVVFAALAHALRSTLVHLLAPEPAGHSRLKAGVAAALWLLFAGVMLVCLHHLLMSLVFPWGGGEFHMMFAYTPGGRVEAAWYTWMASVLILGVCAIVFSGWVPLRWWLLALLASMVGIGHWWDVLTWQPQSAAFHQTATWLMFAVPVAVLLLSGAGAWLRSRWSTYRSRSIVQRTV